MRKIEGLCVVLLLYGIVCSASLAAEPAAKQPQMSPEEQKMMEAMQKAGTPGPQHQELAAMAGSWEFTGTFWSAPGAPPSKSTGTAERTMLLGGRVLQEKVVSSMMDQPFEGIGLMGYDNVAKEHWSTWMDNMSTCMMLSTGKCDKGECEHSGTYLDPVTGQKKTMRSVSHQKADSEVHESFEKGPDGKEFKMMELAYKRKK